MNDYIVHEGKTIMNDAYSAEFDPLIYAPTQYAKCRQWINFFLYVVVLLSIIGFMITDFVFGYSSIACISDTLEPMPMSLSTWFIFSGWFGALIIIFAINFGCCWTVSPAIHLIINMIPQLIMFSWLLLGNVVYWKNYYGNNTCEQGVISYLMVRFYVGFLLIVGSVYHEIKSHS
jgi:hypothetical protein